MRWLGVGWYMREIKPKQTKPDCLSRDLFNCLSCNWLRYCPVNNLSLRTIAPSTVLCENSLSSKWSFLWQKIRLNKHTLARNVETYKDRLVNPHLLLQKKLTNLVLAWSAWTPTTWFAFLVHSTSTFFCTPRAWIILIDSTFFVRVHLKPYEK